MSMGLDEKDKAIGEAAFHYVKRHKEQLIFDFANPEVIKPAEKPITIFMAGSPGAGKTELRELLENVFDRALVVIDADQIREKLRVCGYSGSNAYLFGKACTKGVNILYDHALHKKQNILMDGTFADAQAEEHLNGSIRLKRVTIIFYIYRDPFLAWEYTKAREAKEGRRVGKDVFINLLFKAYENVKSMKQKYGDDVKINMIVKSKEDDYAKRINPKMDVTSADIDKDCPLIYTREQLQKGLL